MSLAPRHPPCRAEASNPRGGGSLAQGIEVGSAPPGITSRGQASVPESSLALKLEMS